MINNRFVEEFVSDLLDNMSKIKSTIKVQIDEWQADDRIVLTKDQALDLLGFDKKKYKII